MKTIFKKKKPYYDGAGNLYLPTDIGRQSNLNTDEWWYLVWDALENKEADKGFFQRILGSRTKIWRTRKSLREKGYLA